MAAALAMAWDGMRADVGEISEGTLATFAETMGAGQVKLQKALMRLRERIAFQRLEIGILS